MQREDIKAGLRKRGYTLATVAQKLGVSRQAVSLVLAGKRSQRIESYIAGILATAPESLWPERYIACGQVPLSSDKESV